MRFKALTRSMTSMPSMISPRLGTVAKFGSGVGTIGVGVVASEFENPVLFAALPFAIAKNIFVPQQSKPFECPHRQELERECGKASLFDKLTISPVNAALGHNFNMPLSPGAKQAIIADMRHTSSMRSDSPSWVSDCHDQAKHQKNIAREFSKTGEHEGAVMHTVLAGAFTLKAKAAELIVRAEEVREHEKTTGPMDAHQ